MSEQPKAFVVMPFEPDFDGIYGVISTVLQAAGFHVTRADSRPDQSNILMKVIQGVRDADLVVADLTTLNPNVFYELGIAHGRDKRAALLTQNLNEVPFDLRSYNVYEYSTHFGEMPKLEEHLKIVAAGVLDGSLQFTNPVTDFWGASAGAAQSPQLETASEGAAALGDGDSGELPAVEDGILDWQVQLEELWPLAIECMNEIGEETGAIGVRMGERTAEIQAVNPNQPGAAMARRGFASKAARDINEYTGRLKDKVACLQGLQGTIEQSQLSILVHGEITDEDDRQALSGLLGVAGNVLESTSEAILSTRRFRNTVDGLRHISRDMNVARLQLVPVLDRLMSELQRFESFFQKVQDIIGERLSENGGLAPAGA